MSAGNEALFERARAVIPGGVNSPVRAFGSVGGTPYFVARAEGPFVFDVEGNRYIDYLCGYGPNLFGYGHEAIDAAYVDRMKRGDTMTGPGQAMVELAEALTAQVSHADWAMFCKSGTDATTMAMMIACFMVIALAPTDVPMALATSLAPTPQAIKNPKAIVSNNRVLP